jgi:hypothetical protein
MPTKVISTYNSGRDYTQAQMAEGAKLGAIFDQYKDDLPAMAVTLDKAGYKRDSGGQIFLNGELVPFPEQQRTGVTPYALAKQVVNVGAPTPTAEPDPLFADKAGKR